MITAVAMSDASAPAVSGFVESTFNPLVHQAVERCLTAHPGDGSRTAMVLASMMGDATTLDAGSRLLVAGQPHNALLFMQSTANAILGRLGCDFGITGPLLSLSTVEDLAGELLATGELLLEDGELDRVVLVGVELAATGRTAATHRALGTVPPAADRAVAVVLDRDTPAARPPSGTPPDGEVPPGGAPPGDVPSTEYGNLRGLVALAARIRGTTA
jgi:3-oxoacyl-(acyl-carrier-protein) synthase